MADKNMEAQISVEFEEATSRQSLNSGETINTLWSKVKRWLSDLKAVAFSGSYIDLSDKPTTATTDTDGLMSAEDKGKLDSVDNTYALKSKYGDTTIDVGRKADTVIGAYSTAEGRNATASGNSSHAEGLSATASGLNSHAEGFSTTASGDGSHAEGYETTASGDCSHAEGTGTTASGYYSHAEGTGTTANGLASHAGGTGTKALHDNEVAYGKYNESKDDTVFSVGDGTADDARHNAFEITTTGGKLHDKDIATTDLIPTTLPANGGNADTVNGHSVNADVPENAVFTDTVPDLSAYAKKADIPTELPANGGNAETVDGYHIRCEDVATPNYNWFATFDNDGLSGINPERAYVGNAGNAASANCVKTLSVIGTASDCTHNTVLEWANSVNGFATACVITAYGYPSDLPIQSEGFLSIETCYQNLRKYVIFKTYDGNKIYERAIWSGAWSTEWNDIYTSGNKPYVTGSATVAANTNLCESNHGFIPSAVIWWNSESSGVAKPLSETQFIMDSVSTYERAINYMMFK